MPKDTWNRITGKDIYNGIGQNSYTGMGEIRNMNISDEPGIAMINRSLEHELYGGSMAISVLGVASTDQITVYAGSLEQVDDVGSGRAIEFSDSTMGGVSTGTTYFVKYISSNVYELYTDYALTSQVTITSDGGGIGDTIDIGNVKGFYTDDINNAYYIADSNNRIWRYPGFGNLFGSSPELLQGNSTTYYTNLDLVAWKGYLFVFHSNSTNTRIDVCDLTTNQGNITSTDWTNTWFSDSTTGGAMNALVGQDDAINFCNGPFVGSIIENVDETFDPTTGTTYTQNGTALELPDGYECHLLKELGQNLMIAVNDGRVYPWDRVSDQVIFPIIYPSTVSKMINTNNLLYTFHNADSSIYVADSVSVRFLRKLPEFLTKRFTDGDQLTFGSNIVRFNNKLLFGISTGTDVSAVWALNLDNNAIYIFNTISTNSAGTVGDSVYIDAIGALKSDNIVSPDYHVFWRDSAETPSSGVDVYDANGSGWYNGLRAYITTSLLSISDLYNPVTPKELEVEFDRPLRPTGGTESVKLAYRRNTSDTFTDLKTEEGSGQFKGKTVYNFKTATITGTQVQFRIYTQSDNFAGTTRCRIKEIRFR